MRVCIHKGTQEIGGTCIEIAAQGLRIVLDVGLSTDDPDTFELHSGFAARDPSLLGVIISHPHEDRYGLASRFSELRQTLVGEAAECMLEAAGIFSASGLKLKNATHLLDLLDRKPIFLGPFKITAYLLDHSACDSYAILVEADGERLFYTGDLRGHGRKAGLLERLINDPPPNVNALLMEGTCAGREKADEKFPIEDALIRRFTKIFQYAEEIRRWSGVQARISSESSP